MHGGFGGSTPEYAHPSHYWSERDSFATDTRRWYIGSLFAGLKNATSTLAIAPELRINSLL
jgi:hypothetical protein